MFRFNIRDLLWLMVVVGLIVAWWANMAIYRRRVSEWETNYTFELMKAFEKQHQHELDLLTAENERLKKAARANSD